MKKTTTFLLIVLIVIIASFLRLYHITSTPPGLYPDEAMNGNNALEALHTSPLGSGFKVYYPENNGREGLFIAIQALFLATLTPIVGHLEPWVLRLPSALVGILTVLGMYFMTKELFRENPKPQITNHKQAPNSNDQKEKTFGIWDLEIGNYEVALLAAFFTATSFWHINFSRIGFRAIMAPLLLVWATYLLLAALRHMTSKSQISNLKSQTNPNDQNSKLFTLWDLEFRIWSLAILGGLLYGLGFYTYISYRVSPLLLLLFIPFFKHTRNFWKIVLTYVAVTFVVALPIGTYYLTHPADFLGRTSQVSVMSAGSPLKDLTLNIVKTAGMFFVAGDGNWRHNVAGRPEVFLPVALLFLLGMILLIVKMSLRSRPVTTNSDTTDPIQNPYLDNSDGTEVSPDKKGCNGVNSKKHEMFAPLFLFGWLILAALPVVISNEGIPHALRSILMIPPVFAFAAYGGIWLYQLLKKYMRTFWLPLATAIVLSLFVFEAYTTYFVTWAQNPNVPGAFSANYVEMGKMLNDLPNDLQKYVVVKAGGVLVNGIPMPTQTVMFITDTYLPQNQQAKNIHYVLPENESTIPKGAFKITLE